MNTLIWDKLPDCILDKIYSKIIYKQNKDLLEDIRSYTLTINFIKGNIIVNNDNTYKELLWYLILYYDKDKDDNKKIHDKYINIINSKLVLYYIKRYIMKLNTNDRYRLIRLLYFKE